MAFKMKNPSIAKMVKMAGNNRTMAKMKMEAAAKMKKPMKLKEESMAKQKYDIHGTDKRAYKVDQDKYDAWRKKSGSNAPDVRYLGQKENKKFLESYLKDTGEMKKAAPKMKKDDTMAKMKKPMKMKKGDTMAKKALVGKQKNLPPELKAAIEAAPGKLKKTIAKKGKTQPRKPLSKTEKMKIPIIPDYHEVKEKGKKKIISTTPQSDYYDPTYKRRTKVGKLATKVANVFRGDKKDKNVNVKKKQ